MLRKTTRFVKYEHIASGRVDNMPEKDWNDHIIRNRQRKNEFRFIELIDIGEEAKPIKELEIVEDEFQCPLCDFVAIDDIELDEHKQTHL